MMKYEGHFCLWFYLLHPFVRYLGMDYHALYLVSVPLMSLAAWLLLFKVKFSTVGKLAILFSMPFLYFFPVVSRCYALIPPIAIAMVAVYQRKKHPFLYCFLLGLLAHTHAYMEGLVAILWLDFLYRYVIQLWRRERWRAKRNLYAALVTVFIVILAFLQVAGSLIDAYNGTGVMGDRTDDLCSWAVKLYESNSLALFDSPDLIWLNRTLSGVVYGIMIISCLAFLKKSKRTDVIRYLLIINVGILWQLAFALFVFPMFNQRVFLPCIPLMMVLGMGYSRFNSREVTAVVLSIWLLNTPVNLKMLEDVTRIYDEDSVVASEVEKVVGKDANLIADWEIGFIEVMPMIHTHVNEWSNLKGKIVGDGRDFYVTRNEYANPYVCDGLKLVPVYSGFEGRGEFCNFFNYKRITVYSVTRVDEAPVSQD